MKKLIGITGGIGAGKSVVCKIFHTLGVPVFNADESAKYLVNSDQALKESIIQLFGNEAYTNGIYNKKHISKIVFNDKILLQKLNGLIHPKVREAASHWVNNQTKAPYFLYEAALMKAEDKGVIFNKIIVVSSPIALRIKRIIERDNRSETEIKAIIDNQMPEDERLKMADYVIENDEKQSLIKQVLAIDKILKSN